MIIVLKYLFLFTAIVYTFCNVVNAFRGNKVHAAQLFLMALGIIGYLIMTVELGY